MKPPYGYMPWNGDVVPEGALVSILGTSWQPTGNAGVAPAPNSDYCAPIQPGEGYRLIAEGEVLRPNSEVDYFCESDSKWKICQVGNGEFVVGKYWDFYSSVLAFRVKLDTKPSTLPPAPEYFIVAKQQGHTAQHHTAGTVPHYIPTAPPFVHTSESSAREEAKRLCRAHGGRYVVFMAVTAYEMSEVQEVDL